MVNGIIGKKVGMTQLFLEDGTVAPATVLQAGPCVVVQGKTAQTDGYEAVQIGLVEPRGYKANKATVGHFKKANVPPTRVRREVKIAKGGEAPKLGDQVLCSMFNAGERVDVIGTSKGRGFQGTVKRHHFRGGDEAPIDPGMRMHGHMGMDRVTTRNLKVLRVDAENNLIVVRGAVPGANGGYVLIRKAVAAKPEPKPQLQEKPKKGKK